MDNNDLSYRQRSAISYFLSAPSIEEACKRANISRATFYKWMKDDRFKREMASQRDALIAEALERLKCSINKATEELIKLMDSKREDIRRLASKDVIEYALKSIELEEIEQRVEKIEKVVLERRSYK